MLRIRPVVTRELDPRFPRMELYRSVLRYEVRIFWLFKITTPPVYFNGSEFTT